jgi:hypothetical protein
MVAHRRKEREGEAQGCGNREEDMMKREAQGCGNREEDMMKRRREAQIIKGNNKDRD